MLERNVEVTYEKLYDEITSPSHIAKIRLGFKCKDKYRRPFAEEVSKICGKIVQMCLLLPTIFSLLPPPFEIRNRQLCCFLFCLFSTFCFTHYFALSFYRWSLTKTSLLRTTEPVR